MQKEKEYSDTLEWFYLSTYKMQVDWKRRLLTTKITIKAKKYYMLFNILFKILAEKQLAMY